MTDLELMRDMFTRRQVPFQEATGGELPEHVRHNAVTHTVLSLTVENAGDDDPDRADAVWGYSSFYTEFHFTEDGDLLGVGIWE